MQIRFAARLGAILVAASFAASAFAAEPVLERWRSYAGVSWDAAQGKPFANSVGAPIAGIHFDTKGRAFVSTPRLVAADAPATLSILDTRAINGPARLSAFPSPAANDIHGAPATHLRNVLGFHIDRRNGWLWALDQGFVAGEAEAPPGGQKIMVIDLESRKTVRVIPLDAVADRKGSFLNDIVVDEARRLAFVSDSGLRSAPRNQAAIIVADFATGGARRLLDRHPSVLPQAGAKVMAHGEEVWAGKPLVLGVNGIALSPDAQTLYWTVTSGTHAWAIPTALLRDPQASDEVLAKAVRDLGDIGGNTDGIVTGADGTLYITDVTRNGLAQYDPRTGTLSLLAAHDGVHWPDTVTIGPDGDVVFTASHLNRHFAGQVKQGEERYELWRVKRK